MSKRDQIENIHENLVNGNRTDCVKAIKKYGLYDFWSDYKAFLEDTTESTYKAYDWFTDMTISYFRITNR